MPLIVFKILNCISLSNLAPALNFKTIRLGCVVSELHTLVQTF